MQTALATPISNHEGNTRGSTRQPSFSIPQVRVAHLRPGKYQHVSSRDVRALFSTCVQEVRLSQEQHHWRVSEIQDIRPEQSGMLQIFGFVVCEAVLSATLLLLETTDGGAVID